MESEHFRIVGTRRINRRHCAIQVRNAHGDLLKDILWPWSGPLHYADVLGDNADPKLKAELTALIEAYTK